MAVARQRSVPKIVVHVRSCIVHLTCCFYDVVAAVVVFVELTPK